MSISYDQEVTIGKNFYFSRDDNQREDIPQITLLLCRKDFEAIIKSLHDDYRAVTLSPQGDALLRGLIRLRHLMNGDDRWKGPSSELGLEDNLNELDV